MPGMRPGTLRCRKRGGLQSFELVNQADFRRLIADGAERLVENALDGA